MRGIRAAIPALVIVALVLTSACYKAPPASIQDLDYTAAEAMVRAADRIDRVKLLSVEVKDVDTFNPKTGDKVGTRPVTYLEFQYVQSFKGSLGSGDTMHVAVEHPLTFLLRPDRNPIQFTVGQEYLVFVKGRALPAGYPTDYGGALWTPNGEPWIAKTAPDGALQFAVTDRYLAATGKDAIPFELDLKGLELLTSK